MVSTNILGNAMATRMAVQDMRRRNTWGHIINMVGLSGHRIPDAPAGGTFFAATKFAVRAITEGLRQEARANKVGEALLHCAFRNMLAMCVSCSTLQPRYGGSACVFLLPDDNARCTLQLDAVEECALRCSILQLTFTHYS
jgi:NAD(P)-dependent dehydrogenase (short-subunit alcohol dehydrogenase family)